MAIFGVKIQHLWQAGSRVKITPGNGLMRHITPQCMEYHCLRPFWPFPGTYPGLQGSKDGYFFFFFLLAKQPWAATGTTH